METSLSSSIYLKLHPHPVATAWSPHWGQRSGHPERFLWGSIEAAMTLQEHLSAGTPSLWDQNTWGCESEWRTGREKKFTKSLSCKWIRVSFHVSHVLLIFYVDLNCNSTNFTHWRVFEKNYYICEKSGIKPFVAPEEAAYNLLYCG